MALAALICAYHDTDGGGLRAMLPLAGRPLIERQVRLAAAAGARPIVVLVERVPGELLTVIDRLRTDGLPLVLARSAAEAAEAAGGRDRLLLVADGLLAEEQQVQDVAAAAAPTLLTVPDVGHDERFERIDAETRWAGLALVDTALLRVTAASLDDWDLQSTLLRRAVQQHAQRLPADADGHDAALAVALDTADLAEGERHMVAAAARRTSDWASRYLLAPIEASGAAWTFPRGFSPEWIGLAEGVLIGLAALLFLGDWRLAGMLFLVLALPLGGIAMRLSAMRLDVARDQGWTALLLPTLGAAALLALGRSSAKEAGWGALLLAAVTIAFMVALRGERPRGIVGGEWLAERKGLTLLMVPFAAAGLWTWGLGALLLFAAGSFFWAQHQVHGRRRED